MLRSLSNTEVSTVSSKKTYKNSKRSHVNKSTALLDKSNSQILEERKIDKIPDTVRTRKFHKARKLFVKTPKDKSLEKTDELDLILMDIHKANVVMNA